MAVALTSTSHVFAKLAVGQQVADFDLVCVHRSTFKAHAATRLTGFTC